MRRAVVALACCFLLAGCAGMDAGSTPVSSTLGPGSPSVPPTKSTLPQRMKAGVAEVWVWYDALKSKVDPALEPMKRLYVAAQEMGVAVKAQDWLKALSLGATAWALVDQLKEQAGS